MSVKEKACWCIWRCKRIFELIGFDVVSFSNIFKKNVFCLIFYSLKQMKHMYLEIYLFCPRMEIIQELSQCVTTESSGSRKPGCDYEPNGSFSIKVNGKVPFLQLLLQNHRLTNNLDVFTLKGKAGT